MTEAEQKLIKIKEQNKARAKKYYEAHKEEISQRRKDIRKEKQIVPKQAVPEAQPVPKQAQKEEVNTNSLANIVKILKEMNKPTDVNNTKQLYDILDIVDLKKAFDKPKIVLKKIEEATHKHDSSKIYKDNSKKSMIQTVLLLIDTFNLPTPAKAKEEYSNAHILYKVKSKMQSDEKKRTEVVMDFDEYLQKIEDAHDAVSKEYILASLYKLSGFRDNLQLKIIYKETPETIANTNINYIVVPSDRGQFTKRKNLSVILNVFKTDKKYKKDVINVTKELSTIIRKYMGEYGLEEGDYLFGDKPLSRFISEFNKKLGFNVTINKLRQMRVSYTFENNEMTAEERVKLAKEMKHSFNTSELYLRKVGSKK